MAVLSDDASKALVAEKKLTSLPSFCSLESWSCVQDVTYFDTCFCASVPCQITNHLASHTLTSLLMDWCQPDTVPQFIANSFYSQGDPDPGARHHHLLQGACLEAGCVLGVLALGDTQAGCGWCFSRHS